MCDIRLLQMGPWQSPPHPRRVQEVVGDRREDLTQASCAIMA